MTEELSCGGCGPEVPEEYIDPEHLRKIQEHPCFSKEASHRFGRIHLPVAPECNIQCNFCLREFDCVNESRPGVTSQVLTPSEALERVKEVVDRFDNIRTIGIAGPGDPLANEETFQTFELVRDTFPDLHLCLSSNGLLLPDKIDILNKLGVHTITVTMSVVDPEIGKEIYSWVYYEGKYYRDFLGAELLLSKQLTGIKAAAEKGMLVKVNTVMMPTINDRHIVDIARKARELGAFTHNIMPLIPQYKFAHLRPPTATERKQAQDASAEFIPQMRHCRQCRADAIGLLGQDLSQTLFASPETEVPSWKVAVTSSQRNGIVDLHFGQAERFLIYEVDGDVFRPLETRELKPVEGQSSISQATQLLADCRWVVTAKIGPHAAVELEREGIKVSQDGGIIEEAIKRLIASG